MIYQLFDPEDIWYDTPEDAEAWRARLLDGDYDYVLLYRINDGFVETFSPLFCDGTPEAGQLYAVDPATGKLHLRNE